MRLFGGVRYVDAPCPDNVTRLDHGILPIIADMHKFGIRLDVPYLNALTLELRELQRAQLADIQRELGAYRDFNGRYSQPFNVGSPDHVSRLFFEHLRIQKSDSVPLTEKGKRFSTDDDTLNRFRKRHVLVDMVLDWRELEKFCGTYTEPLVRLVDGNHYLHPRFNTTVVATGRLSVGYVQTIPIRSKIGKRIRGAFIASPGCSLVSCDLSQIEMRWAAHLSQDPNMCDVFHNDGDIHVRTACAIFERDYATVLPLFKKFDGPNRKYLTEDELAWCKKFKGEERLPAKTAGFGTLYETGPGGLQKTILNAYLEADPDQDPETVLEQWPEERCLKTIEGFYAAFPRIRDRQDLQHRRAMQYGLVWDAFGRVRLVPEAKSALKKIRGEGFRAAGNHEVQGSAQGSLKIGMARITPVYRELHRSFTCFPSLQIHDQMIFNVDHAYANEFGDILRYEMEQAAPLSVPVLSSADVGERWIDL